MYQKLFKTAFFTATINKWQNLLSEDENKDVVLDSLKYFCNTYRIKLYAYVIMPNHIHLILELLGDETETDFQRDFLKFTAQQMIKRLIFLDREEELINYKSTQADRIYQIWQRRPKWVEVANELILKQKVDYIHDNPLQEKWKLVFSPKDYQFSSASFYSDNESQNSFLTSYFD